MQAKSVIDDDVRSYFANLLKESDEPECLERAHSAARPSLFRTLEPCSTPAAPHKMVRHSAVVDENIVRPAVFHRNEELTTLRSDKGGDLVGEDPADLRLLETSGEGIIQGLFAAELLNSRSGKSVSTIEIRSALDVVHEAGSCMRAAEERARDELTWTQSVLAAVRTKLKDAENCVRAAETRADSAERNAQVFGHRLQAEIARTENAERRAFEAEARATDAENWLRQMFQTIIEEFPPVTRIDTVTIERPIVTQISNIAAA